ncbi:Hemicentin-1 [Holothuria leucospilota]|uniref:Hemicentin-1 n=1 Tax=Holothuria leucospilota TaxID=206669 RepID=A0A9Q1CPA1_HOLLE|nr:Hemicentin-1 [Holothuria leucospilota]
MRVNKPKVIFSSLMVLFLVVVLFPLNESQQSWTVAISSSVLFPCNSDPYKMRIWEHDNNVLFNNKLKIDFKLDHIYLLDNYSLLIQEITLPHKGIYRCLQDGSIAEEFLLNVEVPPKMFLTINEFDSVMKISVEEGTDITLFCHAFGALPPVNLSWAIDGEENDYRALNFTVAVGDDYQGRQVFNSVSSYTFKLIRNNGTVSCRSNTVSGVGKREINLQYSTFGKT